MAVLNEISVGNTTWYLVDAPPSHGASRGSVAMVQHSDDNAFMYVNIDGADNWLKHFEPKYGEIYVDENTTTRDTAQNSWVNLNGLTWVSGNLDGFTRENVAELTWGGSNDELYICQTELSSTVQSDEKWMDFESMLALNNFVPTPKSGATARNSADLVSIAGTRCDVIGPEDYYNVGLRWTEKEAGGGPTTRQYIPKNTQLKAVVVDRSKTLTHEDFEGGLGAWTLVNDTTNVWVSGTAEAKNGSNAAYISDDGGTTASYTITTANVSHMYQDITFPTGYASLYLTFWWKSWSEDAAGDNQYDYGTVHDEPTSTTPVAGTELANGTRIGATTNAGKFNEGYGGSDALWRFELINVTSLAGSTRRIVFSFKNDGSVGDNPPFVIDDFRLQAF